MRAEGPREGPTFPGTFAPHPLAPQREVIGMNYSSSGSAPDTSRAAIKRSARRLSFLIAAAAALAALVAAGGRAQAARTPSGIVKASAGGTVPATCVVHSLPSFV